VSDRTGRFEGFGRDPTARGDQTPVDSADSGGKTADCEALSPPGERSVRVGSVEILNEAGKIEEHLKGLGWPVTRIAAGTLRSSFRAGNSTFPLVVQFEGDWVRLMVLPITRMPADPATAETLYAKLLQLNGDMMLARFSLDEDGDVLLSAEFPIADLNPSEIKDALDVITYYAQKYQPEIRALNPPAA